MGSEDVEDQRRHTELSNITKWTSVSTERITRESRDRAPDGIAKEEVVMEPDLCSWRQHFKIQSWPL